MAVALRSAKKHPYHRNMTHYFEEIFIQSWWVILIILACYFCYEEGMRKRNGDYTLLLNQFNELEQTRRVVKAQQDDLWQQINSQSDPAWVELILMKGLGLAPEGQTKVLFTNQKELLERTRQKGNKNRTQKKRFKTS